MALMGLESDCFHITRCLALWQKNGCRYPVAKHLVFTPESKIPLDKAAVMVGLRYVRLGYKKSPTIVEAITVAPAGFRYTDQIFSESKVR